MNSIAACSSVFEPASARASALRHAGNARRAGMVAANYLYNIARHDGSEIGMVGRGVGIEPLLDPKDRAPRYVAAKFNWIGTPSRRWGWCSCGCRRRSPPCRI